MPNQGTISRQKKEIMKTPSLLISLLATVAVAHPNPAHKRRGDYEFQFPQTDVEWVTVTETVYEIIEESTIIFSTGTALPDYVFQSASPTAGPSSTPAAQLQPQASPYEAAPPLTLSTSTTSDAVPVPTPAVPAPVIPAPVAPAPIEPPPVEPAPVEPAPIEPAPAEPAPVIPAPSAPIPAVPAPAVPAPIAPAPIVPAPVALAPVKSSPVAPAPIVSAPVWPGIVVPAPAVKVAPLLPSTASASNSHIGVSGSVQLGGGITASAGSSAKFNIGYTGTLSFYDLGLGSCGITDPADPSDYIVAISKDIMARYDNGNPNKNPLCNQKIVLKLNGKSIPASVHDTCASCENSKVDCSRSIFRALGVPLDAGLAHNVEWAFV